MFKVKIKSIAKNFLLIALLLFFAANQGAALLHGFSHHDFAIAKTFDDKMPNQHRDQSCTLCFSANLQNQILASVGLTFAFALFYLSFFSRSFDRVKASYILSSYASRAPPFNS